MPICNTLEDPWLDNMPNVSCIPFGEYICKRIESPRFKDCYEITNVPGRTHVLFHKGNTIEDTHGCILVGANFETHPYIGIARSSEAYAYFWSVVNPTNEFKLTIKSP